MNKRALKVLEYDKVIKRLSELACSPMGRELAENLVPSNDIREVKMMQQETDEAVNIIFKRGSAPIEGLVDIRDSLKKVQIGSMLEPGQLLGIADHLRCARRVKGFKGNEIKESYPMIDELISGITPNKKIEDDIYSCIISEDEVSDRASVTLYNIRKQIKDKNSSIRDRL
ncbi:MAG TPA: endonuclease MutS2, partial [Clostridiaceae bacterium]|nr:endonuclease MutS2 [Clostridiaceae bacterium]